MSADVKEVIQEVTLFFRFDLRKKWSAIEAKPTESGWEVQAELLDPRPDLSSSYKKVYDQNIYRVEVSPDLNILSCEKIGERQKDGQITFFPSAKRLPKPILPKVRPAPKEPPREQKVSLDPSLVGRLADEISKRVSSTLEHVKGPAPEEEIVPKGAFIDPHEQVELDYNFERVGKVERQAERGISSAVKRLQKMTSASKQTKNVSRRS